MPKLKTPRAAEPNKPGCLKYGATVFCALGAYLSHHCFNGIWFDRYKRPPSSFCPVRNYDSRYHNHMASMVKESSRTSDFERNIAI